MDRTRLRRCTVEFALVPSATRIIRDFSLTLNGAAFPDAYIDFSADFSISFVRARLLPIADRFSLAMGLNVEGGVRGYSPDFYPSVRLDSPIIIGGTGCDGFFVGSLCSGTTLDDPNLSGVRIPRGVLQSGYQFSLAATASSPGTANAGIRIETTASAPEPATLLLAAPTLALFLAQRYRWRWRGN